MESPLRFVDAPFYFIFIFTDGVGGRHSMVAWCIGDTLNSLSCGIVWFVDILSVYCRSCLPNELGVRDRNWLFGLLAYPHRHFLFYLFIADEMFLEQRRHDIGIPLLWLLALTMVTGKVWRDSSVSRCGSIVETAVRHRRLISSTKKSPRDQRRRVAGHVPRRAFL